VLLENLSGVLGGLFFGRVSLHLSEQSLRSARVPLDDRCSKRHFSQLAAQKVSRVSRHECSHEWSVYTIPEHRLSPLDRAQVLAYGEGRRRGAATHQVLPGIGSARKPHNELLAESRIFTVYPSELTSFSVNTFGFNDEHLLSDVRRRR
jgi:hypothetical protein